MDPDEWKIQHIPIEDIQEKSVVVFPYPVRYGGSLPDSTKIDPKLLDYDKRTSE